MLSATLKGGSLGGTAGLVLGVLGVYGAGVRYPAFRHITLPLRAFLVTSSATFGGTSIISQPIQVMSKREGWLQVRWTSQLVPFRGL